MSCFFSTFFEVEPAVTTTAEQKKPIAADSAIAKHDATPNLADVECEEIFNSIMR